jgi:uncharacterized protein DUF2188
MGDKSSKGKLKKSSVKPSAKNRKTNGENLHVVPRIDGWAVRSERKSRATSIHSSQREAIDAARKLAKKTATQLVIHGRDGRIRERDSYASDPLPPREPRKILYPSSTPSTNREAIRKAVSEAIRETREGRGVA